MKRLLKLVGVLSLVAITLSIGVAAIPTDAADHLEAPLVMEDGRLDINDIYAFQSPDNPENTVLVLTVNPFAGVLSPTAFRPGSAYRFNIDNDGDNKPDVIYTTRFGKDRRGKQRLILTKWAERKGIRLKAIGRTGKDLRVLGGGKFHAGLFDDPFFFDFQAFQDQVKGAGGPRTFCDGNEVDFFAGANVSAIVLEVPSSELTGDSSTIKFWSKTRARGRQFDRMGLPAIATVLIPDGSEDDFNATRPKNDVATWSADVQNTLLALSGLDGSPYSAEEAEAIANVLLPDVLTLDTASSDGFVSGPLNGRQLADDVIDLELVVVTGGFFGGSPVLTSDCVDTNDVAFQNKFPYLGKAQEIQGYDE